jgi:hypothetical protein
LLQCFRGFHWLASFNRSFRVAQVTLCVK